MNKHIALAQRLVQLLTVGDEATAALLSEDVVYQTLGLELKGCSTVLEHLTGAETGQLYRQANWSGARWHGDAVLIEALAPEYSLHNSKILLIRFHDDRVSAIHEQLLLPMRRSAEAPLQIGDDLKEMVNTALAKRNPMLLAYVDEDGQPALSFRGSVHVFSHDRLALWVRNANGRFLRAIAANPKVALMYRDEETRATFQFQGRAQVTESEIERKRVFAALSKVERDHDFAMLGMAVIIDLDRIEGYAGVIGGSVTGAVNMRRI